MDIKHAVEPRAMSRDNCASSGAAAVAPCCPQERPPGDQHSATFGDVLTGLELEIRQGPVSGFGKGISVEPAAPVEINGSSAASLPDMSLSDSVFAASMASFTSDLHAELSRLAAKPAASLYFEQPLTNGFAAARADAPETIQIDETCAQCMASLETSFPEADSAMSVTFCLCCRRPLLLPRVEYVMEEDAAFPRCTACMQARQPPKPVVEEEWWLPQYKHALLSALEGKLWRKLSEVGNLQQSGESARHSLYLQRSHVECAQRQHEQRTLEAIRRGTRLSDLSTDCLFHEWLELQAREDAENFRIIVLISKCLQELGRGLPAEVGEALQLYRGRDLLTEYQTAKLAVTVSAPTPCGCCPAMLTIPAPSGVPLPNPCFCFCCARMVPESWMYIPEADVAPLNGDLCLNCAAAHENLDRKMFLVSASPTMIEWKRHKVAVGLERQLSRVRQSTALAYKSGSESEKDTARWKVADGAAKQWQARMDKLLTEQRTVLRRGWTQVTDSRHCYSQQVELEKTFVTAIPPLLKILANLLVRQRMTHAGNDRTNLKRSEDSHEEARSDERECKYRKF